MVRVPCKEHLHDVEVGFESLQCQHQGREVYQFRLVRGDLLWVAISRLHRLDVNLHRIELAQAVLEHVGLAVEGGGANNVAHNAVLVAPAESNVANIGQRAASGHKVLDDWQAASDSSLNDEGCFSVDFVCSRHRFHFRYHLWSLCEIHSFAD